MYKVIYYKDRNGRKPVAEYIDGLAEKTDKDSRIKLAKIRHYIKYLGAAGLAAGEPYVKHLDGDIWELRPISDRILFAAWDGRKFILLHHFVKKTQKTPRREIEQAMRNLEDHRKRSEES